MHKLSSLIPLFLIAVFAAPETHAGPGRDLDIAAVHRKIFSPGPDLRLDAEYVFRDEESWCGFWDLISSHGSIIPDPSPECPAVDFRRETVVAVVGAVNGCEGNLQIVAAERTGRRRATSVFVEHYIPCPDALCTQIFFGFVEAVVIGKRVGEVDFVHEAVQLECLRLGH